MKVGIHNECSSGGLGGAEYSVAVLAEALSKANDVELIHHKPEFEPQNVSLMFGADLSRVRLKYVTPEPYSFGTGHNPWARYSQAKSWRAELSRDYDLFISFTHGYPAFSRARRSVLVVLFPFDERPARLADGVKRLYHDWEWMKRLSTYETKIANSEYSRIWARRRWGIQCDVIYPPVDLDFIAGIKTNTIISVGRFSTSGHSKRQIELMAAFREMGPRLPGWEYVCAGGIGTRDEDREYLRRVELEAAKCNARVAANVERRALKNLYSQAKLFWHAAGYADAEERPELAEHFGIATVEAMAAGAVPLAFDRGEQPRIIEHGVSGFVWTTPGELEQYSCLLAADDELRAKMSEAARCRAKMFSRDQFVRRFLDLVHRRSIA